MSFDRDFTWQRALIPDIKRVLAEHLITEAPVEEDRQHNTDLIVLKLEAIRVACRLRRHSYLAGYSDEFTLRESRPSGTQTELAKMISGWGDYIFYGFANPDQNGLAAWVLGDLKVFRLWHTSELWRGKKPGTSMGNGDGSSTFRAYKITDLPPGFVVARNVAPHPMALF